MCSQVCYLDGEEEHVDVGTEKIRVQVAAKETLPTLSAEERAARLEKARAQQQTARKPAAAQKSSNRDQTIAVRASSRQSDLHCSGPAYEECANS